MFAGFARGEKSARSLAAVAVLAFACLAGAPAFASEPVVTAGTVRLFGSSENTNYDISPFPKWTAVLARYAREQHLEDVPCRGGNCALQEWKAFVTSLKGQDRRRQLEAVNAYANRIPYMSDQDHYGVVDYWATPREALGHSADCEDYAIVKYFSLRKLGWSADQLRIVVLNHEQRGELHAVLVAYLDGTAYVLDNLTPDVREHAAISYYRPIFSINEVAWYFHRDWNPNSAVAVARVPGPVSYRSPSGASRALASAPPSPEAAVQAPGLVPAAVASVRPDPAYQPPLAPAAAPSYAANRGQGIAEQFSNAGLYR